MLVKIDCITIYSIGFARHNNLEAELQVQLKCTHASPRFESTQPACRDIIRQTYTQLFPVNASQEIDCILHTVSHAAPERVAIVDKA